LTPCLAGVPNAGTAVPPTTRVHAAISTIAPHEISGRVNFVICHTVRTLLRSKLPGRLRGKHPW
jgi:hypothetical protein